MSDYAFDTSVAAIDTLIEQGVIALVEPLLYVEADDPPATPEGPYLRTLQSIPQLPGDDFMSAQRSEFMLSTPGVLVYVGDGKRDDERATAGANIWIKRELLLVIFSGTVPDVVIGRLNETDKVPTDTRDDPGVRVIREHLTERLHWKFLPTLLDVGHSPLQLEGFGEWRTTDAWSAWTMVFTVSVQEQTCSAERRAALPLDEIRTIHDVQDRGEIARQIETV